MVIVALTTYHANAQVTPVSQMEKLDRGLVAVPISSKSNFISWRLLGTDEKTATTFDLLRDGAIPRLKLSHGKRNISPSNSTVLPMVLTKSVQNIRTRLTTCR